ncbi:unnamed protein product [Aspergillus oryzae]|nr:unnamed protein product [Aspergillus oryzae]GMF85546.1 unnamed protein product [Aspergillus oryzae]
MGLTTLRESLFRVQKGYKKTDLEEIGAIMGPKPDSNMSTLSVNTMWIPELLDMAYAVEAPIPGYGVEDLSWEVQTTPGGPKVNLNGTVQEVHEQLLAINPNYEQEFAALNADKKRELTFEKRDTVTCYQYPQANHKYVESGIKYLRSVPGQPTNGPGPNNCGRVSCSYNAAIWWCNDVSREFTGRASPEVKELY